MHVKSWLTLNHLYLWLKIFYPESYFSLEQSSIPKIELLNSLSPFSKTYVKWPLSKVPKIGFQDPLLLNAGQKYCRMLQGEHSAILMTFIRLPFVIKIFISSIFEWPFYTGFISYHIIIYCILFDKKDIIVAKSADHDKTEVSH